MKGGRFIFIMVVAFQCTIHLQGQEYFFDFGEVIPLKSALSDAQPSQPESIKWYNVNTCLLYTSPSPRDGLLSRMPSSA